MKLCFTEGADLTDRAVQMRVALESDKGVDVTEQDAPSAKNAGIEGMRAYG